MRDAAVLVAVVAVGFGRPAADAQVLYYLASVALVGLALVQVLRGFSGDLVEPRRRMRAVFTIIVGVEIPEYRVRRIINQQLEHRNFNAFLNELRTEEACRILADPANERVPIFNLALDLGYGSVGPFNRAFRVKTGQTPTGSRLSCFSTQILKSQKPFGPARCRQPRGVAPRSWSLSSKSCQLFRLRTYDRAIHGPCAPAPR